ncbi:Copper-transporting ATPase HMA5 [Colletotrichum orbiculare MAFF 240422]|uniref:Copper-transporting ATPase HMA5 n=1 Tax=Colletotrichum orbiculare (strain 104-T / ATCC 96160 / CBS 514.97 / LARS 414 / MAFF 240422) TaxID=1213857 RepID=A0A484G5Z2_COLOR|nr:Copper-transporting ATPase HMA5 [Colletotrichum orbiculare MAFF 240422]
MGEDMREMSAVVVDQTSAPKVFEATLAVDGMTRSSCVGAVTEALEHVPWIQSVTVNLVANNAAVLFKGRSHLDDIISAISDLGYDGALNDLTQDTTVPAKDLRRTVCVRVDGMYCSHCPGRVIDALKSFAHRISIEKQGSLNNPFFTLSYTPHPPKYTVRTILEAVSTADEAFTAAIHHPPTVEERSLQTLRRAQRRLLWRLRYSIVFAVPTLVFSIMYMNIVSSADPGQQNHMELLDLASRLERCLFIMATPVYLFAASVFHEGTIIELCSLWRRGSPTPLLGRFYRFGSMDMLASFATTIAYFSSLAKMVVPTQRPHNTHESVNPYRLFHMGEVVFLTLFLLAARMIEAYSKAKTGEAVSKLGRLRPKEALLPTSIGDANTETQSVSVDMLESGDVVKVVQGGSPPWDGIILEGSGEFIETSLTGDPKPVMKHVGDSVYCGTVNKGGPITIRVTGAPESSLLDQIIKVVREGQARRAPIERAADTITGSFVPAVMLIAMVTWLTWLGLGLTGKLPADYNDAAVGGWPLWSLQFAIAVLVVACPCGIGLAVPTAFFVGGGLAVKYGILAKGGGEAFQEASRLDIIVFDKTGTLTGGGEPKVTDHRISVDATTLGDIWTEKVIYGCLSDLENNSSHPIAKARLSAFVPREAVQPSEQNTSRKFLAKA